MAEVGTTKLDELFRKLPDNTGLDPRLIEDAKTELNILKFRAGVHVQKPKSKSWGSDGSLKQQLQEKETEILLLKRQLQDKSRLYNDGKPDVRLPTKIKDKYARLYDTEWDAAYEYFRRHDWTEIEIVVTLQRILRASFSFCQDVAKEQLENIEGEALYPSASWMDDDGIIARMKQRSITDEIKELARLYQRTTAQECLRPLQKTFMGVIVPTFINPIQYNDESVDNYCKLCVDISWSMCVQDPPLVFIDKLSRGADFDTDTFRKYKNANGDKFDFLVWPALLLHKDGPLISKGIAQPIKADRPPTIASLARTPQISPKNTEQGINMDDRSEDDHNSWDRGSPAGQTPPNYYRREPSRQNEVVPHSPYFDPNNARTPRSRASRNGVPDIVVGHHDDTQGRYSSQSQRGYRTGPGNLTVAWKQERAPSAP
ncbi:uncharacterized protein LOC128211936 [Mya arenaria]|uniref:uncharacterized protein LOC128211936 n=1 Tax=Mya arenaria TaxID=6604 RepID=UPI0022E6B996|nr:uncharacterized protein LOC128211936 [Mya arenaria]